MDLFSNSFIFLKEQLLGCIIVGKIKAELAKISLQISKLCLKHSYALKVGPYDNVRMANFIQY